MKGKGMILATAAAGLILAGGVARAADSEKAGGDTVSCAGINACKGQGSCAGAGNACAGQNACKGKGVSKATKEECAKKGGKVVEGMKH
jgi:hypothetical protein